MRDVKRTGLVDGTTAVEVADTLTAKKPVNYQIQFTCRDGAGAIAVPAAGTCTVKGATDQIGPAEDLENNSVDLTDRTKWLQIIKGGSYHTLDLVIASLTTNYTVDVLIRPVAI